MLRNDITQRDKDFWRSSQDNHERIKKHRDKESIMILGWRNHIQKHCTIQLNLQIPCAILYYQWYFWELEEKNYNSQ